MNIGSLSVFSRPMSQGLADTVEGDGLPPRHLLGATRLPGTCGPNPRTRQPPSAMLVPTGEVPRTPSVAWKSREAWPALETLVSLARHGKHEINMTVQPSGCECVKASGSGGCIWGPTYRGRSLRRVCAQLSTL